MVLRWGIASAGKISNDFASALKNLPTTEHTLIAVAARDKKRAEEFALKQNIPNAYSSYEELASNPNIDVVYVGSLNPQHFSICKLLLENGKHVLCEKPMCMTYKQTEELIKISKEKKLFLMEGIWSRFFPVYDEVRKALENGTIGDVLQVTANFGVVITADRVNKHDFGGGVVLDLGVYTCQIALLVFGSDTPYEIISAGHLNEDKVDESYTSVITYPKGKTATLLHSSRVKYGNDAYIYGTKGFIKIHEPLWCPTKVTINKETMEFPLPKNDTGFYNYINSAGLHYEAKEVHRCIEKGLLESPLVTQKESLVIAKMRDKIRSQLGVKFNEDNLA